MIQEAIVLAGGKGTRLQSVVNDVPKPMAPVNNIPFLNYLLADLSAQGIQKVILAVGYKHEVVVDYYGNSYKNMDIVYVVESTPLGTGGAIKLAIEKTSTDHVLVVNGDTFFEVDLAAYYNFHVAQQAMISLALKYQEKADRYGTVAVSDSNKISQFKEKEIASSGWINGGVYLINKQQLLLTDKDEVFSFEKEVLEKNASNGCLSGFQSEGYFIDIGIPQDYEKVQSDFLSKRVGQMPSITKEWTLFLDRDGVINKKRDNDYVKEISEFKFLPGAKEAIARFNKIFGQVVIVTNQQCVGKGIVASKQIDAIHDWMRVELQKENAFIDKIYFAPNLAKENHINRKPRTGMAEQAKIDFEEIDFSKSIMVGDSLSDMDFGKRKGMITVGVGLAESSWVDFHVDKLFDLLKVLV